MWTIRDAINEDAAAIIALVGSVFAEVPGWVFDVAGEMPDLGQPHSYYQDRFGRCWVAEADDGGLVGLIACLPVPDRPGLALRRLYVAAAARGQGLGSELVRVVEGEARRRGASFIDLWAEARAPFAHPFMERVGYLRLPETRGLCDQSQSIEYHYRKLL